MIIGLTGTIGAGKGGFADFLKGEGFVYLSLSDELREIAKQRKIELTRKNLQDLGNKLREEEGSEVLAKLVSEKIYNQKYSKATVDGIRNPSEVSFLRENLNNYFLVSVDAPIETRFERIKKRNRESDPKTLEEFLQVDARDKGVGELETGQGVAACMKMADFGLINNVSPEQFKEKIKGLYKEMEMSIERPSWDEYYMKMASLVAERSTCLRHHVGAVIVRDRKTITTGYNGAAKNIQSCRDLGECMRNKLNIPSGERHEKCKAIHAEQNAIIQAAYHGVSVKDSTLYSTHSPCIICAKMIVNAGIKEVISYQGYADKDTGDLFKEAKVNLKMIKRPEPYINFKD